MSRYSEYEDICKRCGVEIGWAPKDGYRDNFRHRWERDCIEALAERIKKVEAQLERLERSPEAD